MPSTLSISQHKRRPSQRLNAEIRKTTDIPYFRIHLGICKGAGTSDTQITQIKEDLSANDTSRHPKVLKIGQNHGCQ